MNLAIFATESISTDDRMIAPLGALKALRRQPTLEQIDLETFAIYVPDHIGTQDNLGTYKPWFNGMKHFYTVKTLPPKPRK